MWKLRTTALPQSHADALAEDPDLADAFLGVEPELDEADVMLLAFYLDARAGTPREAPVDRAAALSLYERIYGPIDVPRFLQSLAAMEAGFYEVERKRAQQREETA